MQNRTFLVLLRPIFGEKLKTAPPKEIGCRSCEIHVVIRPEKEFGFPILVSRKISLNFGEDLFFFLSLFFWRPPVFGQNKRLNFRFWPKNQPQFR